MQQILIIAYFFPPCNLTASQRPLAWAKYLPEFGYEPVIVTRNWDTPITTKADLSRDAGASDCLEQKEGYTVWYMPYRGNLRDRLLVKHGDRRFSFLRKSLTFFELLLQNFYISHLPYCNIYTKAREILRENPGITKMIITANPFTTFHFGYLLKKEFARLQWIADYRDDWTTNEEIAERSFLETFIHRIEHISERKWVATASCITSVSDYYVSKISSLVNKPGHVILNGYAEDAEDNNTFLADTSRYIINFTGTLYPTQPIEIFLDAFKILKMKFAGRVNLVLQFPGLAYDKKQEMRVRNYLNGMQQDVYITKRMPKDEAMRWQRKANLMLMLGHKGLKGISSSKLYEYVGLRKKVLLVCNDHDIMESIVKNTGLGIICDTADEIVQSLTAEVENFIRHPQAKVNYCEPAVKMYSRKEQVRKLAEILQTL